MDIRVNRPEVTDDERAAVDAVLGAPGSGWEGGRRDSTRDGRTARGGLAMVEARRPMLLPTLHAVQDRIGWISKGALDYIAMRLTVPPAEVWGVASFYHLLHLEPSPPVVAHVCDDIACRRRGADQLCARLEQALGPAGAPPDGATATWKTSPCLGQCETAPAVLVVRAGPAPSAEVLAPAEADEVVAATGASAATGGGPETGQHASAAAGASADAEQRLARARRAAPQAGDESLWLLGRCGAIDPASVDDYRARGGYRGLTRAVELGPAGVLDEIEAAGLVGRGGAAFPTARKWKAVAGQREPIRYVVCNADESEPGTFKDRVLLEWDPLAVIEGMTIAALATGSNRGFLYVRGEYPLAIARVEAALAAARAAGMLGMDAGGAGFDFDIEVRRGGGAYICGEETALFASIEGLRGEPRTKPPYPVAVGLFGKPTAVNNVETLACVPAILDRGAAAFAQVGSGASRGPKLYCVSGDVTRPGLYEAPFGVTLRELLATAGGVAGDEQVRAILLGGAAGSFVGPDALDLPLTLEALRGAGASLGSGVVMVFGQATDFGDVLARIARFFREESCGQCVPCRVGTVRQEELLVRLRRGQPLGSAADERTLLTELGQVLRDASICGLGQTASTAIESAVFQLGLLSPEVPR